MFVIVVVFYFVFLVPFEGKEFKIKKNRRTPKDSVQKKKLITVSVTHDAVLKHHGKSSKDKRHKPYTGIKLAFVTPWNPSGMDNMAKFAHKFDIVSPVWFEYKKAEGAADFSIHGTHDIDAPWVAKLRGRNRRLKVVPRMRVELKTRGEMIRFFQKISTRTQQIYDIVKKNGFDGIVVEWGFIKYESNMMTPLLSKLKHKLGRKLLIIVAAPAQIKGSGEQQQPVQPFTGEDFVTCEKFVDYVIVMAYDYPLIPLSPLSWGRRSMKMLGSKRQKLLMGLQFYGYRISYTNEKKDPIVGHQYLELLEKYKPRIRWDNVNKEHFFRTKMEGDEDVEIRFPTLKFLEQRLKLSKDVAFGIAIWELGQGLEYFFDLF